MKRCKLCGKRFDRPSFYKGCRDIHSDPDIAQKIVASIVDDLNDRRGLGIDSLDDEIQDEIYDCWADIIRDCLPVS